MGIIVKKGAVGTINGKTGNVVTTKWRNKDVVKSTPRKQNKKKDAQPQPQNLKLGLMSKMLSKFKKQIKIGFNKKTNKLPGFQMAMEYNIEHAIKGEHPNFEIDYEKVIFSRGCGDIAWGGSLTLLEDNDFLLTWETAPTSSLKKNGKDILQVMVWESTNGLSEKYKESTVTRDALSTVRALQTTLVPGTVHVWIFFSSPDGKTVSNTRYMGSLQPTSENFMFFKNELQQPTQED